MSLPTVIEHHPTRFEARPGVFLYDSPQPGEVHWHLNFANADVFAFYSGPLLAQDELQVLEHPAMASLRHALLESGHSTFVVEAGQPTPLLISSVERRCHVHTSPDPAVGRHFSLYGNAFAAADMPTVRDAVIPIRPPTRSNILAIEAPAYGSGRYSEDDIAFILQTAITGFAAARLESSEILNGATPAVAIHTGFWGCGAYGGNRHLMTLLQLIAACAAGIDTLVYHTVDQRGLATYREAETIAKRLLPGSQTIAMDDVIAAIHELGFDWGVSNGT